MFTRHLSCKKIPVPLIHVCDIVAIDLAQPFHVSCFKCLHRCGT
uniref:Uncharacterized protein n=1 Tax=Arundo donax TaxID=35708 RepID=A0A0A8YSR6_ARUDO